MDFPAEVSTNSYALEGSSDIAYAICVLAKSANSGLSDASKLNSESSQSRAIERLGSAENELRRARILVSLDRSRGELFTFYRKEDLQKDAKLIFNRVVNILRKNECQMSSKNAIKTADMLRPERVRLHRLFVYALLSMIKSVVQEDDNVVAVDLNTFLCKLSTFNGGEARSAYEFGEVWELLDLNLQLLPNGQVMAMSRQDPLARFKRLSSMSYPYRRESFLDSPGKILLALTGHYARYTGGYVGKLPRPANAKSRAVNAADCNADLILERYRQQTWKVLVGQWFAESELDFDLENCDWIEVEVPMLKANLEHPTHEAFTPTGKITWKPILWPTTLCYMNIMDLRASEETQHFLRCLEDPLQFIEDWIASSEDRKAAVRKMEQEEEISTKVAENDEVDMSRNSNIVQVDAGQAFQRIASLDGQAVATIYPTPPDGTLSQVTPGVFSVDGMAATPGEVVVVGHTGATEHSTENSNLTRTQVGIGSGLYDEDLFEDVSGENFDDAEMIDEPNWDFFDEPEADTVENADRMELDTLEVADSAASENQRSELPQIEHLNDAGTDSLPVIDGVPSPPGPINPNAFDPVTVTGGEASSTFQEPLQIPVEIRSKPLGRNSQPLSPLEVRKRLFPDMASPKHYQIQQTNGGRPNRRTLIQDHFDASPFRQGLKIADSRYSADGDFWFETRHEVEASRPNFKQQEIKVPRIGIPKKEQIVTVPETPDGSEPAEPFPEAEDTDFDSSDFFSETSKQVSPVRSNGDETDPSTISKPVDDVVGLDTDNEAREEMAEMLELLRPVTTEQSFARNHQPMQRQSNVGIPISPERLMTIAQVMVDQVSQSFFRHGCSDILPLPESRKREILRNLHSIYGNAAEMDVARIAEMTIGGQDSAAGNGIADCPLPFIRLARADTNIDALPTIQPFWETLGLQPISGRKNITAICIHPAGKHIEEGSLAFLARFAEIYSNCNLGSHTVGDLGDMTSNGLVEWDLRRNSPAHELLKICEQLGSTLTTVPTSAEHVVVYIFNPFVDENGLADICSAFVALFTNYAKACGKIKGVELNLQIIPISFIASSDTIVVPSQPEYLSLALEVYNRCPLSNSSGEVSESGTAVTLAESVPKKISFNLASEISSPLSKDGEILHLAYSQSVDLRWLTACWTDKLGKIAFTMTYCLRHKGSSVSRSRSEVVKEMWEISQDIVIKIRGKWRLAVAHDGPIEPEEINEWSFLANQNASNNNSSHCILILLTFYQNPSMQFSPATPPNKPQPPAAGASTGKQGTPVSTPTAAALISSPEQFTASTPIPPTPNASNQLTAPTPPPDHNTQPQPHSFDTTTNPGATLIDPTDESWSLLLPFPLNNSPSPLESRPALQSGFLLKRRGPLDSDGLVALGVNLIYASSSSSSSSFSSSSSSLSSTTTAVDANKTEQRDLLREVITQWRGLYTLARTKSLGGVGSILPWHIRTAVVGCRAVSEVL